MAQPAAVIGHADRSTVRLSGRPALAAVSLDGADGIGYVARLLARALADIADAEPWIVTLDPASPRGVALSERARFLARLVAGQGTRRADWVLYNHVGIARAQRLVPAPLRRPYGVFVHGIEVWGGALDDQRRETLRAARLRVSNSGYTATRLMAEEPSLGRVVPCPLGLLPAEPPDGEIDAELLARVGARSALIVGRMSRVERYKGHDELVECWPRLRESVPDAQLVIAGRGDDVDRLREKAASLGLGDAVLFAGFVSDATLDALLHRVRLLAMPSKGEGFGLVYLEAMRRALPVIASVHDAAGDVVEHERTGILVDQDDRDALAAALSTLLRDAGRARALGEAGRRRYEREFTYERFRDRLGAVLVEAFGTGRG